MHGPLLDLEKHAEAVTRIREEFFYIHVECIGGMLQVCASHTRKDEGEIRSIDAWELDEVLALLDWA